VNNPVATSVCYGGQPCTVTWLDDGQAPLLSSIGACYVGLYNGNGTLIQQIEPVNVGDVHSLTFTPDPTAEPNAGGYYMNFTSVLLTVNETSHYAEFSADFTLANMSGDFASPVASDTATIAVPSSLLSASKASVGTTSTITYSFTGSYSSLATPAISTSSGASTRLSTTRGASSTSSTNTPSATTNTSAAEPAQRVPSTFLLALSASALFSFIYL
ncbi:hypothetical protein FOMPIDRAFT_1130555, partial [Fomitopsis schrenkii]